MLTNLSTIHNYNIHTIGNLMVKIVLCIEEKAAVENAGNTFFTLQSRKMAAPAKDCGSCTISCS